MACQRTHYSFPDTLVIRPSLSATLILLGITNITAKSKNLKAATRRNLLEVTAGIGPPIRLRFHREFKFEKKVAKSHSTAFTLEGVCGDLFLNCMHFYFGSIPLDRLKRACCNVISAMVSILAIPPILKQTFLRNSRIYEFDQ